MSGGALIQLMASETFKERNELIGLDLGILIFSASTLTWLLFLRRRG